MNGKQVKLFLVDGTPGGLTTAEITNCTGSHAKEEAFWSQPVAITSKDTNLTKSHVRFGLWESGGVEDV